MGMYKKITRVDFKCTQWFPDPEVKNYSQEFLSPTFSQESPLISKLMENSWFQKGFTQIHLQPIIFNADTHKTIQRPNLNNTHIRLCNGDSK